MASDSKAARSGNAIAGMRRRPDADHRCCRLAFAYIDPERAARATA